MTAAPPSSNFCIVGSAARIRRSLEISPVFLSSGTLKSTRTSTFLPRRSPRSVSVFLAMDGSVLPPTPGHQDFEIMYFSRSTQRFEYPHSLSYQLTSLKNRLLSSMPDPESKMLDAGS